MSKQIVRTRNTRTGDARKIDEWSVKLPGGDTAKFDVLMAYEEGEVTFSVRSENPHFRNCRLSHPDLNTLREELEIQAAEIIRRQVSEGWEPARKLEVRHEAREWREGELRFSLAIHLDDVEWMPGERAGNRGETVIRNEHQQSVIVQRAHEDDFSDTRPPKGCMTSPEGRLYLSSPLRGEADDKKTRIVLAGRDTAPLELIDALNRFSALLAERLGPRTVSMEGFPAPSELALLMQVAVGSEPVGFETEPGGFKGL